MSTPLRFVLRYDPVFLELGRRLASGEWGKATGVSVSAALAGDGNERDLLAFLILLFGQPSSATRTTQYPVSRSIFMYRTFAVSAECVVSKEALCFGREAAVIGSLSCSTAFVEFRLGSDRLLSAARDENRSYRASLAEGDGERYRQKDETSSGGPIIVDAASDEAALTTTDRLLSTGRL